MLINWLNFRWDSPTANLAGGGHGVQYQKLGLCSSTPFAQDSSVFCENSRGFWTFWQDYTISAYQPSGTYSFEFSVQNAAMLSSRSQKATVEAQNPLSSSAKPIVKLVSLDAPATLGQGQGGTVTIHLLASSPIPVSWLHLSLDGPSSNVFGGGSGANFQECSTFTSGAPALCDGYGAGYWYKSYTHVVSPYAENGSYRFSMISVASAAKVSSDQYTSQPSFSVAGNPLPTTPSIDSAAVYKVANFGDDPLSTGTLITNTCLDAASQPETLRIALVLNVSNSNVPVTWLTRSFEDPTSNLEGGGSSPAVTDLGSGNYRVVHYNVIASPIYAPKGLYYYQNLSVKNAGNAVSNTFGGTALGFQLKTACP